MADRLKREAAAGEIHQISACADRRGPGVTVFQRFSECLDPGRDVHGVAHYVVLKASLTAQRAAQNSAAVQPDPRAIGRKQAVLGIQAVDPLGNQ